MRSLEITTKREWDNYLSEFSFSTLFLSWEWGEFERSLGNTFLNYALFDNETLIGVLPIKVINAKRGRYLHIRHGPLLKNYTKDYMQEVRDFLISLCKEYKCTFFRLSPLVEYTESFRALYKYLNFQPALTHSTDAELTAVISLDKSEDIIFSSFRKTTRNLIRRAQNLNIQTLHTNDLSLFDDFAFAYIDTVNRNKWSAYSLEYIKSECASFSKSSDLSIFVSYFEEKPISGAIFIHHRGQAIYHHGGSLSAYRNIPAAYLLHWEAIKYFKSRQFSLYNFWGVSPKDMPNHPWANLSLFKRGFTDEEMQFMHAHDYIVSPFAHITRFFEFLESKLRGY